MTLLSPAITIIYISDGERVIRSSRCRPEPGIHSREPRSTGRRFNAQAKGPACARERRFAARRNYYLPLDRSRRISTPREFRSTGRSGWRGRSALELIIRLRKNSQPRLLVFDSGAVFVCSATTGKLSGSSLNRLNWLPFKSALTIIGLRTRIDCQKARPL
jgi:hypothetical protein